MQKGLSEYVSEARENALFLSLYRSHIHFPKAFSTFLPFRKFSVTSAGKRGRVRKKKFFFPFPPSAYVHERDIRKCFLWKPAITPTAIVKATILGFSPILFPLRNCYVANIFSRLPISWILPFVSLYLPVHSARVRYRGGVLFDILSWSEEERKRDCPRDYFRLPLTSVRSPPPQLTSVSPSFSLFYPSLLLRWTPSSVLPPPSFKLLAKKEKKDGEGGWRGRKRKGPETLNKKRKKHPRDDCLAASKGKQVIIKIFYIFRQHPKIAASSKEFF